MFKEFWNRNKEDFYIYKRPWESFVSENGNANYKLKRICYRIRMDGVRAFIEIEQWYPQSIRWNEVAPVMCMEYYFYNACSLKLPWVKATSEKSHVCVCVFFLPKYLNSIGINNFGFLIWLFWMSTF